IEYLLAAVVQVTANGVDIGNVIIGHAAAGKTPDEIGVARLAAFHANVEVPIVGRGDVHELPGNVCPPLARPPAANPRRIGSFCDAVEQVDGLLAREFQEFLQIGTSHEMSFKGERRSVSATWSGVNCTSGLRLDARQPITSSPACNSSEPRAHTPSPGPDYFPGTRHSHWSSCRRPSGVSSGR